MRARVDTELTTLVIALRGLLIHAAGEGAC
ncbi:hypothetical protein PAN31108_00224 [Pandoraea anhela]|uniref:Uncharacterized protein n=1 Tax=Pandoraea anhela TaxID=2508295 RepID=A0A5E4RJ91_9BURK|nr:hypothetical protein PAN31108_00224 [Pandoraea anhela]